MKSRRIFLKLLLVPLLLLFVPKKKKRIFGGIPRPSIQNIKISCKLTKEEIFELGRKTPYHRFIDFPVEITKEIVT